MALNFSNAKNSDPWKEPWSYASGALVLSPSDLNKVRTGIQNWLNTDNPKIQNNGFWSLMWQGQRDNGGLSLEALQSKIDKQNMSASAYKSLQNNAISTLMQNYFGGNIQNMLTGKMSHKYPAFYYDMLADKIPLERFSQLKSTGITYLKDGAEWYNGNDFKSVYNPYAADYTARQEQESKEVVTGGFADYGDYDPDTAGYADGSGGGINIENLPPDLEGDLFVGYGDDTSGGKTNYSEVSPIDPTTGLYEGEKKTAYVEGRIPKTKGMRAVLGEEIFNLGLKDENDNFLSPESLSQFATYTTDEGTEKPLVEYEQGLLQKISEGGKDPGVDARSLLAIRAKQGVLGAASAGGNSLSQTVQDATQSKMANRQAASSAMSARVSAIEDKLKARKALVSLKTDLLKHNLQREEDLYKLKAKTAVGMAGLEETAASFAAEMAQIKK